MGRKSFYNVTTVILLVFLLLILYFIFIVLNIVFKVDFFNCLIVLCVFFFGGQHETATLS